MHVAVGAALMELRPPAIILVACAWLPVGLTERTSSGELTRPVPEAREAGPGPDPMPVPEPWPAVAPREAHPWLFWRRVRTPLEQLPSPTAALEERPARAHVRRIEPEHEPAAKLEPVTAAPPREPPPEPRAPLGPVVTKRPLELPGLVEPPPPRPAPPQCPRFPRSRQPAPVPPAPPVPPVREWNLWDLERRAREQAGNAPRDEERSALFTHLRVLANADGVLSKGFDELVRESFGTLIEAA